MALLVACAAHPPSTDPGAIREIWPGYGVLKGYLAPPDLPDSLALLPAPPAPGSAADAEDRAAFFELTAWQPTPRGALAVRDARHAFPAGPAAFACALGKPVASAATPHLAMLLRRTQGDASLAPYAAKNHYRRTRPFVAMQARSCVPGDEALLATDGSYPSGHASVGWAWALVLAELAPERADAILQRGRAYAQSRAICGVHWKSDIEAGRLVGAATVARLHGDPVFRAQLDLARQELAGAAPNDADQAEACTAEAAALAGTRRTAP